MSLLSKVNWLRVSEVMKPIALAAFVLAIGLELGVYVSRKEAKRNAAETTPVRVETMKPIVTDVDNLVNKATRMHEQLVDSLRDENRKESLEKLDERNRRENSGKDAAKQKAID